MVAKDGQRGMMSAHSMYASTWRCRRGAEINVRNRRTVRMEHGCGPAKQLEQRVGSAADVSTHQIGIVCFELASRHNVAGDDSVAKPGCESLHLRLDPRMNIGY